MGSTQIPSSIVHMAGSRSGLCTFPPALHTRLHRWAAGVPRFMARTGTSTLWLSPFCSPVAPGSLPWFPQQGLGQLVQQNLPIPATCLSQRSGKSCKQGGAHLETVASFQSPHSQTICLLVCRPEFTQKGFLFVFHFFPEFTVAICGQVVLLELPPSY